MPQNTSSAVMQQRHEPSGSLDDFPTPPWATRALCENLIDLWYPISGKTCWEPAAGRGYMEFALAEYFHEVFSSDIHDYRDGANFTSIDFLGERAAGYRWIFDWIITNPPFKKASQFARRALELASQGVALFVRSAFLEGRDRYESLFLRWPPTAVLQFVERVPIVRGRIDRKATTATSYCWVVWDKNDEDGNTKLLWIPPCRKDLERDEDYL